MKKCVQKKRIICIKLKLFWETLLLDLKSLTNLLKVSSLRAIICVYNCINCKSITCSDMSSIICIPYNAINLYTLRTGI